VASNFLRRVASFLQYHIYVKKSCHFEWWDFSILGMVKRTTHFLREDGIRNPFVSDGGSIFGYLSGDGFCQRKQRRLVEERVDGVVRTTGLWRCL
jgi:hypothetical protein